jgi:hypothetical protein
MKSHTPGPWRTTGLNVRAGDALICFATDHWYAEDDGFYAFTDLAEKQANANLIAAAPELLASLVELESMVAEMLPKHGPCGWGELALNQARQAIAKATENIYA